MEEESYIPEMLHEDDDDHTTEQNGVLEDVITVDQEYANSFQEFQENLNTLRNLNLLPRPGDPLEEYFKISQALSSWMTTQLSDFPEIPPKSTIPIDLDSINSCNESLSGIGVEIISRQFEYDQLEDFLSEPTTTSIDLSLLKEHSTTIKNSWQAFSDIVKLGKLRCQELKWVAELRDKVDGVDAEIKKVEAMLNGVEESRKKTHDEGITTSVAAVNTSSSGVPSINSLNGDSSNDVTVTGIVFSSSLLDEWYTKVVAGEELVHELDVKVKEVIQLRQHSRFRAPDDLVDHIQLIISSGVPELRNRINTTKQTLAHDRRIGRWFDGSNDADKVIADTLIALKKLEVPDFIDKYDLSEEEKKIESLVKERMEAIRKITQDVIEFKAEKIDDLEKKSIEIITAIKDSTDREDQTAVELMTKQLKNLNDRLTKLTDFMNFLLSQTTTDRYSIVINLLTSMQGMRNQMAQIRKTIIEHNDAGLVHGDIQDLESRITEFADQLLTDDSALSKALSQKHAKLLLTIQNIRIALAENKLQMAAYLSPSSPTSPTSADFEFDRLQITIKGKLDYFHSRLASPPTYMIDTDAENEEPERVHGLTCNDDHVIEFTERYESIDSELTTFERSLWVEFWLKSESAKKARGEEVIEKIKEMELKFSTIKDLIKERKHDLQMIKEGREFAKAVYAIRDQLDNIKGDMRRGHSTTDASIQKLDEQMVNAQNLINDVKATYAHLLSPEEEDHKFRECFDQQITQFTRVQAWIKEVHVWFKEAERIRIWIDERIKILDNVPPIDVLQEGDAPATQEQVDEWQKEYEKLERDTEKFDSEDMTRLRAHVKNIMGGDMAASDSMSPADAMTISITLQTLTILDQLLGMLKHRENELAVLALRLQWEREFGSAKNIWHRLKEEIKSFVLHRGRWKPPVSPRDDGWFVNAPQNSQHEVTVEAQSIEKNIVDFENDVIPPTGDIFFELTEVSQVDVPDYLIEKQVNLEEAELDELKSYMTFAKEVLTQRQQALSYADDSENTHIDGVKLRDELIVEESNPRGGSVEKKFIARVIELNQRVEKSWNNMAVVIHYPEHPDHESSENDTVREGVAVYHKKLETLLQETDEALKNYKRALRFVEMANEYKNEAARLENWIAKKDKFVVNRKFDVFREPCKFSAKDIESYVAENSQVVIDVHNFNQDELKILREKVAALVTEVKAVGTKCVNTDELEDMMVALDKKFDGLLDNIQVLRSREPDEVNAAQKRLAWEDSYRVANDFIRSSLKETKGFIVDKASWKIKTPEDINAHQALSLECTTFENSVKDFVSNIMPTNKSNYGAFIEAADKLADRDRKAPLEDRQSKLESDLTKLMDHVSFSRNLLHQRAAVVEYHAEATNLDKISHEIRNNLIQAEKNVSSGPSEIDFETNIKELNNAVDTLWDERGSKIPYPTSPIANEVKITENAVIEECAKKRISLLRSAGEELDKLYETYQSSLALQKRSNECLENASRLQDWIADRLKNLNDRKVDPLSQECSYNESQVQKMLEDHEQFKQENTRVDVEEIGQARRDLELLLEDIKKANCKSVDKKPIREAIDNLDKNFGDLQKLSSLHQLDLNVLQARAKWEDQYGPISSSLVDLECQTNDFIANKARWTKESAQPEINLQEEFIDLKNKVSEFEGKQLSSIKKTYNEMADSMKSYLSTHPPPQHIVDRQLDLNKKFDDLLGRVDLGKQVLEQRDAMNAYLNQADVVEKEGNVLKALLKSAEENGEADPGFTEKLATFNEYLNNLKNDFAGKIPYPKDALSNEDVNAPIKQVVESRMQEIDSLSKELNNLLTSYQETMKLSEELDNAYAAAKKLEDELDHFIFKKASWQAQETPVAENAIDPVIKELSNELEDIVKKITDFENKMLGTVNGKFDDYQDVTSASGKLVPEHVKNRHKAVNELLQGLKSVEDYAKEVIEQRKGIMQYMAKGANMENEAQKIQQILLSNEPSSPGGEGNTVSTAVSSFLDRVENLWDEVASRITYPTCSVQSDRDRIGRAEDCNSVVRESANAQNNSLKSLANSLNDLLFTHQNVLRRKKMIESYMHQANDVAAWIQPRLDTLNNIIEDRTLGDLSEDRLHELIGEVEAIEAARQAYHSAFDFAKNLSNKLIEEMTEEAKKDEDDVDDVKADLEHVLSRSREIDDLWNKLQADVPNAKQRINQALQVVDFKEKANEIFKKINDLSNLMSNTPVEDISDADMKDWQIKSNSLEQMELFSLIKLHDVVQGNLKENFGALSDKESPELEGILSQVASAIESLKQEMAKKIDEAESYRSAQISKAFINRAMDLQQWIDSSMSNFQNAKQNHGIMVENSSELNNKNFNDLKETLEIFAHQFPNRNDQLESIRSEFNDIRSKESVQEMEEIINWQSYLEASWEKLEVSADSLKNFNEKVALWHAQHEALYHIENEVFDGLESRINSLLSVNFDKLEAEVKELDEIIKIASAELEKIKATAGQIHEIPGDEIDESNRRNFDIHLNEAINRLSLLKSSFQTALHEAHNASQLAAFHAVANKIISSCHEGTAIVETRHDELDRSGYYALEMDSLETILRGAIDGYTQSEENLRKYDQQVHVNLKQERDKLIEQNPENNKERVLNIFNKVTTALGQFSDAVALERRELELVRRIFAHTKAAQDIQNWIASCKKAVLSIQVDTLDKEMEICDLEEKVDGFQNIIDAFKENHDRVLKPEAESAGINEPQPEESNPMIKESVQSRTNRVLEDWNGLKELLAHLRTSLNASKEKQEVLRAIKEIQNAIEQVKERVLNIESYITGEGTPGLPTIDDVNLGERELDEIQAEIDHILGPRIDDLDDMINNLTERDASYIQQRAVIAKLLTSLADSINNKRSQLKEAQKLAIFGTKADEMSALMRSLLEVVDIATSTTDTPLELLPVIELQSRSIELETKYEYYQPKIDQKYLEAQRVAEPLKDDWRVEDRLGILKEQWNELNEVALAKKEDLKRLLSGQRISRTRHGRSNSQILTGSRAFSPIRSIRSSTRPPSRNTLTPKTSSSSLRTGRYRTADSRPSSKTPTGRTPSPNIGTPGSPRRPPIRLLPHSVNNYVPDPDDQLDVEVARIVNACPVKIKVSMVEGESGKYMFGEVEPKLCYCRILRSRMVMVRVGGEHANLEQKYIPKARSFVGTDEPESTSREASSSPPFRTANISFIPKGPGLRIEDPTKSSSPLALKRMSYTRKVSSSDRDNNNRSRIGRPSGYKMPATEE
ncbi:17795_t:CDS:2 [Acaulospora morrowiae]|uniref:17795_t:CDS:1 n=1 Tax=Acaulospora morrowiae TaxID=94023 RepID=A0A9N8VNY0_9GLOM|nr:17795_t:CDS:2 [Acaulospora morrowiae]